MSDHDLTDAYAYAGTVIGHGPEPWVIWDADGLFLWIKYGNSILSGNRPSFMQARRHPG
jgi:hypothetical protein